MCWSCDSQGYYKNERCGPCDFSADGSLLAVGFKSTLTLWDPDTNTLRHTLSVAGDIRSLQFAGGSCSHFLMFATNSCIYSFNLLTCSRKFSSRAARAFCMCLIVLPYILNFVLYFINGLYFCAQFNGRMNVEWRP